MTSHLPEPDLLDGEVKSVVFHNEETGFTIMQVDTPSLGRAMVKGKLPAVTVGEKVKAWGRWNDDRRFGRQFLADRIDAVAPQTSEGIERFLASGLIEGIGPTYAKRIVAQFGSDTFRVIDEESQRLEEVAGIGKSRRLTIKDSWKKQKAVRDIMIFLHQHGISTARAIRLFKIYGNDAVAVLRQDPYRLVRDVSGIGFRTADDIATKMGLSHDASKRIEAGILHVLHQAEDNGHCALPPAELTHQSMVLLECSGEPIDSALRQLILDEKIVWETIPQSDGLIFPQDLHLAETRVATAISRLNHHPSRSPFQDIPAAIRRFEEKHHIKLGQEQASAVAGALTHRCFIITGGPGVGKTTLLRAILETLVAASIKPVICAPTGRAAKRLSESTGMEGQTLHRLLESQPQFGFARNENRPLEGDFFIVDEASMIDLRLFAAFLAALPPNAHLLLVGDVDQLPPVGPGYPLRHLIESGMVPVARLGRIYRQAEGSAIIEAAHRVNEGLLPVLDQASHSDFFFIEKTDPESILDTMRRLVLERIPQKFHFHPRDDIQILTPMNRNSLGTKELNRLLQSLINPPREDRMEIERFQTLFRVGDKVIQRRNNYDKEVSNGDIGHIVDITTEPTSIYVNFAHQTGVHYEPGELDELQLAYAITIHKSQGSEFPAVIIPLAAQHHLMLQRNLIYTAMTRGKQLVIVLGDRKSFETSIQQQDSRKRYAHLVSRLRQSAVDAPPNRVE